VSERGKKDEEEDNDRVKGRERERFE